MSSPSRLGLATWVWLGLVFGSTQLPCLRAADTPAHQAARHFMRGINFGNYLEYQSGTPAANASYTPADFVLARAEGFDHVRIPVAWALYCGPGPDFTIAPEILSKADALVENALRNGLFVLLDLHHFHAFTGDPKSNTEQFYAIWRQLAAHFASAPSAVAFEFLNEPNDVATTAIMNGIYAKAIPLVRESNPNRTLFVAPGAYNSIDELSRLTLPPEDQNLIVTVHCYDPYYFTHQGAEWAYPDTKTTGVLFPGPPAAPVPVDPAITHSWVISWFKDYNQLPASRNPSSPVAFRSRLLRAKTWADARNRPVHVGEFGCYSKADPKSRVAYYQSIRGIMDEFGLGWAMWDWKSGFHYVVNGKPEPPGMREALFPSLRITAPGKGIVAGNAAVGKTLVLERAVPSDTPFAWIPISTQTLSSVQFTFTDPDPNARWSYYRVFWVK